MLTLGTAFDGISNLDNVSPLNVPDSIGAVGPTSYIEVLNSSLAIYNKTSGQPIPGGGVTSLAEFFRKPAIEFGLPVEELDTSTSQLIDPVVVYNEVAQRFAIGILDWQQTANGVKINSRFNFAISKDSTPDTYTTNDWDFFRFDTDDDTRPPLTNQQGQVIDYRVSFSDFPKIGYNADGYVISFVMQSDQGAGQDHISVLAIENDGTGHGMINVLPRPAGNTANWGNYTFAPASMHGSSPGDPMWFVRADFAGGVSNKIVAVRMNDPFVANPVMETKEIVVDPYYLNPGGRRAGGGFYVYPGNRFFFSSVREVDGVFHLVASHAIGVQKDPMVPVDPSDSSTRASAVRWYDLVLGSSVDGPIAATSLLQSGTVNPHPLTTDTYLPSIEIAPDGVIGLNYSQSGTNEHLSMYVTSRWPTDPLGFMQAPTLVKSSKVPLSGTNRVGDYSFVSVDPVDGSFWAINEYVRDDITGIQNWGTWIQQFDPVSGLRVMDVVISKSTASPALHPPHHLAFGNAKGPMAGSGRQLLTVPVGGANTVSLTFSGPVSNLQSDHLRVIGLRTGLVLTLAQGGFDYDPATRTASWTFSNWPVESHHDHYLISLSDQVVSAAGGAQLDGDWTNPGRLFQDPAGIEPPYFDHESISVFPSGDGSAGGAFNFIVTMLAGDLSGDNAVNITPDILPALANVGLMGMTFFLGDFNGDGAVNISPDILPALASVGVERRILRVVWLPGDYDDDFDLDAFDRLVFDEYYAASAIEADVNGDAVVTPADSALFDALFDFDLSLQIAV